MVFDRKILKESIDMTHWWSNVQDSSEVFLVW